MSRRSESTAAFTLMELMLALSITSVIGLTVGSVAVALSHAQSHTDQLSESVQSGRGGLLAIESHVRKAKLVTAVETNGLVLWLGDANADGKINVDELAMISHDGDSREVRLSKLSFPKTLSPTMLEMLNVSRTLSAVDTISDVSSELDRGIYVGYVAVSPLAINVARFEVVTDAAPPLSRLVGLRITVGTEGGRQVSLVSSARLRDDETANVSSYTDGSN
ncbi:MAG TPA: hypothetical protein VFJ30_08525 [Phycisphaerae bacterium]|nr:hypothetical protein [Phycisphaerae bacterium]